MAQFASAQIVFTLKEPHQVSVAMATLGLIPEAIHKYPHK